MSGAAVYLLVKLVHVGCAIVAVGANVTYGVWFARANADPASAAFALRGIKIIDDRIANPAYGLLFLTGALDVWIGGIGFGTRWVSAAMGLFVVLAIIAFAGFTPALKRQLAAVERGGTTDPDAVRLARRGQAFAAVMGVIVLAILVLMIFKPR
jgi:uncharacterized membrane protein